MRLIDADTLKERLPDLHGGLAELLCQQVREIVDTAPTIHQTKNDPMTLEELREMDGEPVWTSPAGGGPYTWMLVDTEYEVLRGAHGELAVFENHNTTWRAYRRKPEEGM